MARILILILAICVLSLLLISCKSDVTEIRTDVIHPYTPSDSARANFLPDATDFAIGHLFAMQSPDTADLFVPDSVLNLYLYPLACLYDKRHEIPLLDTLIVQRQVHKSAIFCRILFLELDTTSLWVRNVVKGISPTGNRNVDSLAQLCRMYFQVSLMSDGHVYVDAYHDPVNFNVLESIFRSLPGVVVASSSAIIYWSSNLNVILSSCETRVQLYWGYDDCPSGCLSWDRYSFSVSNMYEVRYEGYVHR